MSDFHLDWRSSVLPNGLPLVTVARPGTPTVAARVYVRAGGRYDVEHGSTDWPTRPLGLAHLTEHLLFRGTLRHSQRELFAAVERLGGTLDADTAKEYIAFSTVTLPQGLPTALAVLAELLSEPALRAENLAAEKAVILEEMRRAQDRESLLFDLFARTLWQRHPLRHPILGEQSSVLGLGLDAIQSFYRQRFVAGNMLLVICGDIAHEQAVQRAAQVFSAQPRGPAQSPAAVQEPTLETVRQEHMERETRQMHSLIGVPTVGMKHPDRSALKIIERVLGMGGSARLYQRLRQEEQLVYSVNTVTAHYEDTGYFAVHTACEPRHAARVQRAILDIWEQLCQNGIGEDELAAAQKNYAGNLARRFETNLALAGIMGIEGLLHRVETLVEAVQRINTVTCEDVLRVARQYLQTSRYIAVSVGRRET